MIWYVCLIIKDQNLELGTIITDPSNIPTNLFKTKSGTKSLKKQDLGSKIETFLRISQNIIIGTIVHKNITKKVGQSKKKWDSSKY